MSDEKDDEKAAEETETTAETEGSEEKAETSASPEAIAKRVAALGEEDEIDKIARREEEKLAERRAAQRKAKKKTGVQAAASKKLSKIGTRAEPKRKVAVAADADPLIERTAKLSDWAKKNQRTVQIVGALIAASLLGVAGFLYWDHKQELEASVMLSKAVADERGRIGDAPKEDEESSDGSPVFKTYDDRREAALKQYREVEAKFPKTGASMLARLAEGSLLLDKKDADGAAQAFTDVKATPLAANDNEVKGRAIEGLGFAYEMKADKDEANKAKLLDQAMAAYKELEGLDIRGFKELAMYHQARVAMAKGDKDKAKELLVGLRDRLAHPEENPILGAPAGPAFPYLSEVANDRLREIDPSAAPKGPPQGNTAGANGSQQISPAQLKKMMEEMQKKAGGGQK